MTRTASVLPREVLGGWRAWLVIVGVAIAAMVPELVIGPSTSDSLRYNIVWADQWRHLVAAGELYPRWLPESWEGFGSPVFYFYPPLFFWVLGVIDMLSGELLTTGTLLSVASAVFLAASGLSMRAWLLDHAGAAGALAGAIAYMLTPYHLYDIYARAALAESAAYAPLPVVLLAIRRIGAARRGAVPLLAVGYAAVVCAHLPLALLASVTLVPAYALWTVHGAASPGATAARLLAGGALGLALAAIYLLPALGLTPHILAEALSGTYYRPQSWFFWRWDVWGGAAVMWVVILTWTGAAGLLVLCAVRPGSRPRDAATLFWCAAGAGLLLLVAGIPPLFWQLPAISQVQFPWRLLILVDFVVVTAIVLARPRPKPVVLAAVAFTPALASVLVLSLIQTRLASTWRRPGVDVATIRGNYADAPEYLPAGSVLPLGEDGLPNPALTSIPSQRALLAGPGVVARARPADDGGIVADVWSATPGLVTARRFAFPRWRVVDDQGLVVPTVRTPARLVGWQVPAGRSAWRLQAVRTAPERFGLAASLVALAVLLLTLARGFVSLDWKIRRKAPSGAAS